MKLESEIPFVPKSAPADLRPVFVGSYHEKCSVLYFRDYLPDSFGCEEIAPKSNWDCDCHQRTFWYPENAPSGSQPLMDSIQHKIKAFLFSLENSSLPSFSKFVQFWAPLTTEDGKRTLSVSKQPFSVKANKGGLCRYRYYCQELCRLNNGREGGPYFGPVGRAFTKGSLEFSPDVGNYSEEDFPLKNHAKHCGLNGYMALPLFELGNSDADKQQSSCVGVLEFVSFDTNAISSYDTEICVRKLKEVGLAFRYPAHSEALTNIRPLFNFPPPQNTFKANPDELRSSLDFVREKYSLPLVQIWLPCICNGPNVTVELEPNSDSFSKVTHLVCGLQCLDDSESKWLFSYKYRDPLVFFIEDGDSWVGRAHVLKKICFIKDIRQYSIMDYPFAALGHSSDLLACFAVPLQLVNPKLPPLVLEVFLPTQYNFDADRGAILKRIVSAFALELSKYNADFGLRKDEEYFVEIPHSEDDYGCVFLDMFRGLPAVEEDDVQHESHQSNDTEIEELQVPKRENTSPYLLSCNGNIDIVVGGQSTLKRKCPTHLRNDVVNVQQIPEVPTISVDSSDDEVQQSGILYSLIDDSKQEEEEAATISIPLPANGKEKTIGPRNVEVDSGASKMPENGKCGSIERGKDVVDDSCTLIVRARHNDDFVRFPFSSDLGIEGLRGDLLKRLELKEGSFKIKYEDDDGYWITLSCRLAVKT